MEYLKNHRTNSTDSVNFLALAQNIKQWGKELGFQQVGISDIHLEEAEQHLLNWLQAGRHGTMEYMQRHGTKRSRPAQLVPGTLPPAWTTILPTVPMLKMY
jgi:epoxyqueuosine reductase